VQRRQRGGDGVDRVVVAAPAPLRRVGLVTSSTGMPARPKARTTPAP
jgi:hypothetical protein